MMRMVSSWRTGGALLVVAALAGCPPASEGTVEEAIEACARLYFCNVGWVDPFRINDCVVSLGELEDSPASFVTCAAAATTCEDLHACQECEPLSQLACSNDTTLTDCVYGLPTSETCESCGPSEYGTLECSYGTCSEYGSVCVGDTIEHCWGYDTHWEFWIEDCADAGWLDVTCVEDGYGGAECVSRPRANCEPLTTRCDGDVLVTCSWGGWEQRADCSQNRYRTTCVEQEPGIAGCALPGQEPCPWDAPAECDGDVLRACLTFPLEVDCAELGGICTGETSSYCSTNPSQAPSF